MSINLTDYYEKKNKFEKNKWFHTVILNNKIENLIDEDITDMLNICFDLFKLNFESNEYDEFNLIADVCESLVDLYVREEKWRDISQNDEILDFLIDIVCFVYELTYKYEAKNYILKKIINIEAINKEIKIRAIENILLDDIDNSQKEYVELLNFLKNN